MPNFLVGDMRTAGGSRAFLYTNGTPAQIGDAYGSSISSPTTSASLSNLVVQFGGELYGCAQNGVYKKDDPTSMTGPWTSQIALTNPANDDRFSGLYPIEVNGVLNLILVYGDASNLESWRWVKFDGTTWTQAASASAPLSFNQITEFSSVAVYHNVMYLVGAVGASFRTFTFNPATDVFSKPANVFLDGNNCAGQCVFEDRLFAIFRDSASYGLYEFTGSWALVGLLFLGDGGFGFTTGGVTIGKWVLFTDGTTMTAIVGQRGAGAGFQAFEWDTSLARTDITTLGSLPATLLTTARGGSYAGALINDERFRVVYDLNSVIGTTDIYLYHTVNGTSGTTYVMYRWNGNNSVMTVVDTGGDVYHALPSGVMAMGERIFTAGELDIKITARVGVVGGEEISFIVYGGGTSRKMKLHYTLEGTPNLLPATLALPVTGGAAILNTGSNQVEGITADGVTVYTILWDVTTDGLSTSDRVNRVPEALA